MRSNANQAVLSLLVLCLAATMMAGEAHAESNGHVVEYYHVDALGSVVAMSDAHGEVLSTRVYEPYGFEQTGYQGGPGYTGHVADSETSLIYMQQRLLDPELGRFLSADPVAAYGEGVESFNRYWYANGNPFRYIDPDGRRSRGDLVPRNDRSSITARSNSAAASMVTSTRGESGRQAASGEVAANGNGRGYVTSVFTGDRATTFTYAAASGVGFKAELKEGPDNDRYAITTPSVGGTAAGTWNLLTAGYDFLPSHSRTPVDVGVGVGGEAGLIGVIGASFRYSPPARFEVNVQGGLGVAARVEIFEVGFTPGNQP